MIVDYIVFFICPIVYKENACKFFFHIFENNYSKCHK